MYIESKQKKILWAFLLSLPIYAAIFIYQANYKFIGYVVVVAAIFFLRFRESK